MSLLPHFWTLAPTLAQRAWPSGVPSVPWSAAAGRVRLTGKWSPGTDRDTSVIVVHGLGGDFDRHYCVRLAREAARRGWSCLRIALRGADRQGTDFYHAGLLEDLQAALECEELSTARRIFVVGYSLGGHLVVRWAGLGQHPRVAAVAAVCPPLDLAQGQRYLDEVCPRIYLRHVLDGLKEIYRGVAARAEVPTPVSRMEDVHTIREWDSLTIVPRWGFGDVEDYYQSQSAVRVVGQIPIPTLVVASEVDPMVAFVQVVEALRGSSSSVRLVSTPRGGHVGFPPGLDLGLGERRGLEPQVCDWLESNA